MCPGERSPGFEVLFFEVDGLEGSVTSSISESESNWSTSNSASISDSYGGLGAGAGTKDVRTWEVIRT